MLTDDTRDPRKMPTRKNMLDAMHWLVRSARTDDSLFFHCKSHVFLCFILCLMGNSDSGHGGQTKDLHGDEIDGFDEGFIFFELCW